MSNSPLFTRWTFLITTLLVCAPTAHAGGQLKESVIARAENRAISKARLDVNRAIASALTSEDEVPPKAQERISQVRNHFERTGTLLFCTGREDLTDSMMLIMESRPYRVKKLELSDSGDRVCVAIEKP